MNTDWFENDFRFQAIRMNDTLVVPVPGEPIFVVGKAMKQAGLALGFTRVFILGLSNGHMATSPTRPNTTPAATRGWRRSSVLTPRTRSTPPPRHRWPWSSRSGPSDTVPPVFGPDPFVPPERYRILRRVGSGGAGVVYAAFDNDRGQTVALKTLLQADSTAVYRFKKEFRTLSDIAIPISCRCTARRRRAVLLLHDGADRRRGLLQVCAAVALASGRGTAARCSRSARRRGSRPARRRDRAPGPQTVERAGRRGRTSGDSGFRARAQFHTQHDETEGRLRGTVAYMAPEQAAGHPGGDASDCYSIGVMLYQALTGQLPHHGTVYEVLVTKQSEDPASPFVANRDLPPDLVAACMRCSPATRRSARSGDINGMLGGTPAAARRGRLGDAAPFVGREREIDALNAACDRCREGLAITAYVHGPSGMGKTALVAHFLESREPESDAVVLSGRCYERESMPYKALDGVVDDLMRHLGRVSDEEVERIVPADGVAPLARSFPVLLEVPLISRLAEGSSDADDPITMRRRGFQALKELLRRIAARQPLIVHVDDLHWCDADGTTLLTDLFTPPAVAGLLLIVTFRSEEVESKPFLRGLLRGVDGEQIRELFVGPLADDQARRLVLSMLPGGSTEAGISTIVREAAGSPFFLEQLIRYAIEHDSAASTGITLAEMLEARLGSLPAGSGR